MSSPFVRRRLQSPLPVIANHPKNCLGVFVELQFVWRYLKTGRRENPSSPCGCIEIDIGEEISVIIDSFEVAEIERRLYCVRSCLFANDKMSIQNSKFLNNRAPHDSSSLLGESYLLFCGSFYRSCSSSEDRAQDEA